MKKTTPYEFLVRMNLEGQIQGAHIRHFETITDDATGEILVQRELDPKPVAMAVDDKGFPLAQIMNEIQVSALSTIDANSATIDANNATIAQLQADAKAHSATIEQLTAVVQELEAKLAAP